MVSTRISTRVSNRDTGETPDGAGPGAGRPLNLRQIEVFRAIMMTGSISGAGRALHVSQPAISRVLALSEQRLGYPLFEREHRRLVPTPEARRLYAEVERVYGGIARLNDLAASLGRDGSGVLRVVASASYGQRLIPRALAMLRQGNPGARIDYRSVTFDELAAYFLSGQADVGVSMQPPDHPSLSSTLLGRQPVHCIMPADHPLARHEAVHPRDFSSSAWIGYPPDTPLGRALRSFFGEETVCPAAIEVHSPVTACAFVKQGLGPALVDGACLDGILNGGGIAARPISPASSVEIWATCSNQVSLPLQGRRFLAALQAVLRDEASEQAPGM